eukprot:CAMPEP_0176431444 /NCGR_PEP_ID=MMETSP0127-20121128/14819_1 /TAXON_ID=938130 /ORGANISM="Platyophrya macrostoma, Strain WH" /LENGTH=726 /DNA_ID=CAMNT_0017813459 /DNA_START=1430 /DNA_END=3610 /DNA_ORIENTATION=+
MPVLQRNTLINSTIEKIGAAKKDQNVSDSALIDLLNSTLNNATQAWIAANTVPPPVSNSSIISGLYISHLSEVPVNHTQHVMQLLTLKVTNASSKLPIDASSGFTVLWTCNKTGFFSPSEYSSQDNTLSNFDISSKVTAGDYIMFNATVKGNNTVVVLQKVIQFVGTFPVLSVLKQADDSVPADMLGVRRAVTLQLAGVPGFLNSTANGSTPANVTFEAISLNTSFYNYNIKVSINLRDPLILKLVQPLKAASVRISAYLPGSSVSFDTVFTLNPSTVQANLPSTSFNLSTLTPTSSNLGDIGASISNRVGSKVDQVIGNLSSNATSSDARAACISGGGTWQDGNPLLSVPASCKPPISAADNTQIQTLADKTLAAFTANSSSYSADDQINFVNTLASARKNGVDLPAATVSKALDNIVAACQNISETLLLSGDSDGGTSLRSSMKNILSARTTLAVSDAEKVAASTSDSSTVDSSKANQRKSLAVLDDLLSAFSSARTSVSGSMTISNGDDTIHSEDLCLSRYSSNDDSYLISISINPQSDADATSTTKFGFYIKKATLKAIIKDKTGNSTDCLNIGGIKTSKAAGACGHQGADKMSNEIVGWKVFDASGQVIDVTGYTLYLEIPCTEFSTTPSCKYLNTASDVPEDGGSFTRLESNDKCYCAVNHLSSYALSSDTSSSSSSSSSSNSTTPSNSTGNQVSISAIRLNANAFILVILSILGLILLN